MTSSINKPNKYAEIHLTYKCDLECRYCNRACFSKMTFAPDMTLEGVDGFLQEAESVGMERYYLTGGEPTLNKDCLPIIEKVQERAKINGTEVSLWTNGIGDASKEVCEKVDCKVVNSHKPISVLHPMQTIFMSPVDLGVPAMGPKDTARSGPLGCCYHSGCGISVDSLGYTVCPIGGMISTLICPDARSRNLKDMYDAEFNEWQLTKLCQHCGAWLPIGDIMNNTYELFGVKMTKIWYDAFMRVAASLPIGDTDGK